MSSNPAIIETSHLETSRSMSVRLPAAERRVQLLDVAMTVFSEHGYHGASMNDVAKQAGVTKPVLYQHFPSKQDLYLELVDDVSHRLGTAVTEAAGSSSNPHESAVQGFTAYFGFVQSNERAFRLLFGRGAPREQELSGGTRMVEDHMRATIQSFLPENLTDEARTLTAQAILGMAEGVCRDWLATGAQRSPDEIAEQLGRLLVLGLAGLE
ncbi:MAG: TetR family transcriptional regulator [Acidimicrobiales bacterium]|jgi:AcrR family transcriptional regulator